MRCKATQSVPEREPDIATVRPSDSRSVLQLAEHGEHSPVVLFRDRKPELAEDVGHVLAGGRHPLTHNGGAVAGQIVQPDGSTGHGEH
jgi:hypothetical protein